MQVAHLEILAKLYILRYQYADAAAVYETLAVRKQGLGDEAVDLSERVEMYRSAVLQVRALNFIPQFLGFTHALASGSHKNHSQLPYHEDTCTLCCSAVVSQETGWRQSWLLVERLECRLPFYSSPLRFTRATKHL